MIVAHLNLHRPATSYGIRKDINSSISPRNTWPSSTQWAGRTRVRAENPLISSNKDSYQVDQRAGFGPLNLGGENFDFDCLVEVLRFRSEDDFLFFFPKWAEHMANARQPYDEFLACFDAYYEHIRGVEEQRELAQQVKKLSLPYKTWPPVLFEMKKEGVRSAEQFFAFIPRARFLKLWRSWRDTRSPGHSPSKAHQHGPQ